MNLQSRITNEEATNTSPLDAGYNPSTVSGPQNILGTPFSCGMTGIVIINNVRLKVLSYECIFSDWECLRPNWVIGNGRKEIQSCNSRKSKERQLLIDNNNSRVSTDSYG